MFHMLGRFAFTSFFSRRSSRNFSMGSVRFWFCCCDRIVPNAFTIFIPTRPSFANQSCSLPPSGGCSTQHLYGPFSPNHTLAEPGDFSHPHRSLPGQKCGMRGRRVDRAPFSGEAVSKTITSGGKDGHHTHDTSRSSDNAKSLNLPDRKTNVRHRWRRFYLRSLWPCHVGGFRSFDSQRQSCLSVRRL